MDVRLSPEQRALVDAAARLTARLAPRTVTDLDDRERAAKLDAAVEAAGWRELRAADEGGSPWASGVEVALVTEELGRALADTAFLGPTLAADLRRRAGAPPAPGRETVLLTPDLSWLVDARLVDARLVDARLVDATPSPKPNSWTKVRGTAALRPPVGAVGVDAGGVRMDSGGAAGGAAGDVAGGAAGALTLLADGGGWRLGVVPLGEATVHADLTRTVARPVDGAAVADVPDQQRSLDADDLARVRALALAVASADLVGTMQGAVELATAYAKERRQFGTPVGSFQAVQHLLADALVQTEGARSVTRYAAWAVDAAAPGEAVAAASAAKAYAGRAARKACESAIQVHGGIGNTWDCLAHVHLRRTLLSTDLFGGVDASLERVLCHHVGSADGLR